MFSSTSKSGRRSKRKGPSVGTETGIRKYLRVAIDSASASQSETPSVLPSSSNTTDSESVTDEGGQSSAVDSSTNRILPAECTLTSANNDIGSILSPSMSCDEVSLVISQLTSAEKYTILTGHYRPNRSFKFPKLYHSGCNRSFQYHWLDKYPWLIYSKILDGGFCKYCVLFAHNRNHLGVLVNKPFTTWVKGIVDGHVSNRYHIDAVEAGLAFKRSIEHPEEHIDVRLSSDLLRLINENRQIIKCCAEAVLYCGRQCIALRGDNEKLDQPGNPGNFLALLKMMSSHNDILKQHLEKPRLKNATYISPQTQNEVIDILGIQIIQKAIIDEVKNARYFAIMVDEVTSHNKELMPLCIRFVDERKNIREEFVQFSPLVRVTGEAIASQIISDLKCLGLDVKNIRGQGYDGASNMASGTRGVQALIKQQSPLATYTHCSGHCLNLVIAHSSSLPLIRNVLDQMKQICLYFLKSPKRNELLSEIVASNIEDTNRRKPLIDLCRTRWAERHSAYQHFYQSLSFVIQALEIIALGLHSNELSANFATATWDTDSKSTANSLLHAVTNFQFLVVFLIVYQGLSHLSGITVKLQSTTLDIIEAFQQIEEIKQCYKEIRKDVDAHFHKIYLQAVRMAAAINVEPSTPRSCSRQRHRANVETTTTEEWYKLNVTIPFLDHIICELEMQFSPMAKTAAKILTIVPSILCDEDKEVDIRDIFELYSNDLPSPELLDQELVRWKMKYTSVSNDKIPSSCAIALKGCDKDLFPNIYILLQIACTLPVTSCECERNASTLRRLHNFMRAGMSEDRLTSLALMHIHYEQRIDLDRVVDLFANMHPRKLRLNSVL